MEQRPAQVRLIRVDQYQLLVAPSGRRHITQPPETGSND
jgi:hypothetical protein